MFRLHRSGGRVKTAGLGLDLLYPQEAQDYADDPTPERAGKLRSAFRNLQENPAFPLPAAFFPQERSAVRQHLQRTGLYRPFLKTDQGPAGTFLPFVCGNGGPLQRCHITRREGLAVPEAHLADTLAADAEARAAANRVRDAYWVRQFRDAAEALNELSARVGFERREAKVGRGLFFFCNPSSPENGPIVIPEKVCAEAERKVNALLEHAEAKAAHLRALYRGGAALPEAIANADAGAAERSEATLWLRADVYLAMDGTVEVDQVQLPDLGLFIGELCGEGYAILPQVQAIVKQLRARTAEILAGLPSPAWLLTRPSVLHGREDTLEHLEIQAMRRLAEEHGLDLRVATPADAGTLPKGAQVLLLNVDVAAPESEALLRRVAAGELHCSPDPFLKLLAPELTTLRRVPVRGKQLERLLRIIRPGGQMNEKSYHAMHLGIERIYHHGRHTGDVMHVEVPGEATPVPTLRHSVHSFTSLYNTLRRRGFPELAIRDVPVTRENAIVHSDTGPHLAAFRFFFSREGR